MLIFWSLVRNSVVLAVYLLFSVACFFTVHEHYFAAFSKAVFHVVTVRYSGMIASLGQTPAQVPQSMQVLGSIT